MTKHINLIIRIIFKGTRIVNSIMNWAVSSQISSECKRTGLNISFEYPVSTYGLNNIQLGDNIVIRKDMKLRAYSEFCQYKYNPQIIIGNNFYSGTQSCIAIIGKLEIGHNVTLASRVTIIDHSHGKSDYSDIETPVMERELSTKGPIIIEDNVWICEGAVILGGVIIGKNSIVAANSVVTKDVPPYTIVAGVPAKIIKTINH